MAHGMAFDQLVLCVAEKVAGFLGYKELKEHQKQIILELMKKRDVFGILPTGYGKSLCYTCMPLLNDEIFHREPSIVIVVTPLTAIMKDQVILCCIIYNYLYYSSTVILPLFVHSEKQLLYSAV